jgi:hypothetical protein
MEEFPVARGASLPFEAAVELFRLQAEEIRSWIADGSLEARTVDGVEFVRLAQLDQLAQNGGVA